MSLHQRRIGRLAGLATRFARHPHPGLFLARHFCDKRWEQAPLNRPESFELHAHKSFDLGVRPFVANSWVRSKTASMTETEPASPIVLIEQDINTRSQDVATHAFSRTDVAGFFADVGRELDVMLDIYYPSHTASHG